MANRLKPLLATYYANSAPIKKIASQRIKSSGEHGRMCKQLAGPKFARKWRSAEMSIVPDQRTAHIIGHHVLRAQEILQATVTYLNEPRAQKLQPVPCPPNRRCKIIRELPKTLLQRLESVFSGSALFDPDQVFKKQFDTWQKSLVSQLDLAEEGIKKGKGSQTFRYAAYREIFDAVLPVIEAWFDEFVSLLAEAGHAEAKSLNNRILENQIGEMDT